MKYCQLSPDIDDHFFLIKIKSFFYSILLFSYSINKTHLEALRMGKPKQPSYCM